VAHMGPGCGWHGGQGGHHIFQPEFLTYALLCIQRSPSKYFIAASLLTIASLIHPATSPYSSAVTFFGLSVITMALHFDNIVKETVASRTRDRFHYLTTCLFPRVPLATSVALKNQVLSASTRTFARTRPRAPCPAYFIVELFSEACLSVCACPVERVRVCTPCSPCRWSATCFCTERSRSKARRTTVLLNTSLRSPRRYRRGTAATHPTGMCRLPSAARSCKWTATS
jgi:hypothetical protein